MKKIENSNNNDINEKLSDKRGKNKCKTREFNQKFNELISSYNPTHSHYKSSQTPKRRYIDSEFNAHSVKTYKDFAAKLSFERTCDIV